MSCCACPKERSVQHPRSPGVVDDQERIALVLLNPDQWKDGKFSSAAFSKTKLKQGQLSVCRVAHSTPESIHHHVIDPQLEKNPERKFVGAAEAVCVDIRSIVGNNLSARIFCVIDAPVIEGQTGDDLGHAHLAFSDFANSEGFWSLNERAAALAQLARTFQKLAIHVALETMFE